MSEKKFAMQAFLEYSRAHPQTAMNINSSTTGVEDSSPSYRIPPRYTPINDVSELYDIRRYADQVMDSPSSAAAAPDSGVFTDVPSFDIASFSDAITSVSAITEPPACITTPLQRPDSEAYISGWGRPVISLPPQISIVLGELRKTRGIQHLRQVGKRWIWKKPNTDEIPVHNIEPSNLRVINPHPDGSFDAFGLDAIYNDQKHEIEIVYDDFIHYRISHYFSDYTRHPACSERIFIIAFYQSLQDCEPPKIIRTPQVPGWQETDGKLHYASSEKVTPKLERFCTPNVLARKLTPTSLSLTEAAKALAIHLPAHWKYKLLLAISVTSILLYFYEKAGLTPDQAFFVETKSDSQSNPVKAILQNRSYENRNSVSITECKTKLWQELDYSNDCMAVFDDHSYVEAKRARDAGVKTVLEDLLHSSGSKDQARHLIAIVTDNIGNYSTELPAYFITMNDCPDVRNANDLRQSVGIFESALIRHLENSDSKENLITRMLPKTELYKQNIMNSEYFMSLRMLMTTVELLWEYGLISDCEKSEISRFLSDNHYDGPNANLAVCDEFKQVLSAAFFDRQIRVVNQNGAPYYHPDEYNLILDDGFVNVEARTLERRLMMRMSTTKKRNKLLHALQNCGKLHANNGLKRNIEVELLNGDSKTVSVYSFPKTMLTKQACAKADAFKYKNFLVPIGSLPEGFLPIASCGRGLVTGRVVTDTTLEAESIFCSGQTRSGKTYYLINQALLRALNGYNIIIIDQTGAFAQEEVRKHCEKMTGDDKVVDEYFSFWEIGARGLPVDILSLEHCSKLPQKKNRIASVLSVGARLTGEVQLQVLRSRMKSVVAAIEANQIRSLSDTLCFFDDSEPMQADIKRRLEAVFDDLDGLPTHHQNWGGFLATQKPITIISTAEDSIRKSSAIFDMLLANLYPYKQHNQKEKILVVVDEITDFRLNKNDPIDTILRKGGKHGLSLLLASQFFSAEKDRLGKLIESCGLLVFFFQNNVDPDDIAKQIGVDSSLIAYLEEHEFIVKGGLYNRQQHRNCKTVIKGKAVDLQQFFST